MTTLSHTINHIPRTKISMLSISVLILIGVFRRARTKKMRKYARKKTALARKIMDSTMRQMVRIVSMRKLLFTLIDLYP